MSDTSLLQAMLAAKAVGGGSGGTTNYNDLSNKPQINGNTLSGNKTSAQLGLAGLDSSGNVPTDQLPVVGIQNTYGVVKNGSSVTGTTGYTACPIVNGVPYYHDTTYTIPSASNSTPQKEGTGSAGSSSYYARADHVHPSRFKTGTITLNLRNLSWTQTSSGLYSSSVVSVSGLSKIYSVSIYEATDIKATDVIQPRISSSLTQVGLYSNVNSFSTVNSNVKLICIGE